MLISLEYHDVVEGDAWDSSGFQGAAAASYKLGQRVFAEHLDAISRSGNFVGTTIKDALAHPGRSTVVLTFDDGGLSAAAIARLLEARGWRAHMFIPTDLIGHSGFLDRRDLVDLHQAGHVVGSHSASHPVRMSGLDTGRMREEWRRSVGVLQDILGDRPVVASVPGGYYSRAVAEAAALEGVEVLFTSEPVTTPSQVEGCTVLGRYTLRRHHGARYVSRLAGGNGAARSAQWLQWNLKKVGKRAVGAAWLRVRRVRFGEGLS